MDIGLFAPPMIDPSSIWPNLLRAVQNRAARHEFLRHRSWLRVTQVAENGSNREAGLYAIRRECSKIGLLAGPIEQRRFERPRLPFGQLHHRWRAESRRKDHPAPQLRIVVGDILRDFELGRLKFDSLRRFF